MSDKIIIFDTTLRDGEQSPGATMTLSEKRVIAAALDRMGVDVIEAGFAIASLGDFQAVETIAQEVQNASVCALARAKKADIEAAAAAVKMARRPRIHTFISTSAIHMAHQLHLSEDAVLNDIGNSVRLARRFCDDVEWSAMDASRSSIEFLVRAVDAAICAGATTINLPDTVGYALPEEYAAMFTQVRERVANSDKAIFSVHCHNDLGMAVANSLAGVRAGARQVECTINGIGERAGNAALEEIVMALRTRADSMPFATSVDAREFVRISRLVSTITGFLVQKNKAVVGINAFAHESGIHQDGILKERSTYEIMTPESVGFSRSELVLGKHSGRAALRDRFAALGVAMSEADFAAAFERFKHLADRKKNLLDEDILSLVRDHNVRIQTPIEFRSFHISGHSENEQSATVVVRIDGIERIAHAQGDGPLDAIFKAVNRATQGTCVQEITLETFEVHGVTHGPDAQAEATIGLIADGRLSTGSGRDTDTLVAATQAYVQALNKIISWTARETTVSQTNIAMEAR